MGWGGEEWASCSLDEGKALTTAHDAAVRVWDVASMEPVCRFTKHRQGARAWASTIHLVKGRFKNNEGLTTMPEVTIHMKKDVIALLVTGLY